MIQSQLEEARQAAPAIQAASDARKQDFLMQLARLLEQDREELLAANRLDLARMADGDPKKDRLLLTPDRVFWLAQAVREVANLPDPAGKLLYEHQSPEGLHIQKISVPLGVIGVIYESRPNVTVDVAALCLRAGNAVVLRGGSDAAETNRALVTVIHRAMRAAQLPESALQLLPSDRAFMQEFLRANRYIDVIIPRGSQELIQFVRTQATIPVIETGAGVCHTYIHQAADLQKAASIVVNAKTSRPSVCNALDTVLVDAAVAAEALPLLLPGFGKYAVRVFADEASWQIIESQGYSRLEKADADVWGREFLDYACSVKVVRNLDEALAHIRTYSSRHSEAIVSEDAAVCETFLQQVDAAAVYANASTRFTDGSVFGLGAEIGISTQKLHARGPFALEKLVTEKWVVRGNGQIR